MAATGNWVPDVTGEAMVRLLEHAKKVGSPNTDEFTFRAMFMVAAHDLLDAPRFQTEWNKFDLLVQIGDTTTVVEFKYYMRRFTFGLGGERMLPKGGPSRQNEKEFWKCVHKLRTRELPGVGDRWLVLLYDRPPEDTSRYSFHRSYGDLAPGEDFMEVWPLNKGEWLEARVLRIRHESG